MIIADNSRPTAVPFSAANRAAERFGVWWENRCCTKPQSLRDADLTEAQWRAQWESARWFLSADGESGKKYGDETIRLTSPDGQVSIRLPAPLAHFANAPHHRYILTGTVVFAHRVDEWADRVAANHAVAYRIHYQPDRDGWYLDGPWQRKRLADESSNCLRYWIFPMSR